MTSKTRLKTHCFYFKYVFFICSFIAVALCSKGASAWISVETDAAFGPGALTRDSTQSLDFLDLEYTTNMSFTEVSDALGVGMAFEGFRYATHQEVYNLVTSAYPSFVPVGYTTNHGPPGDSLSTLVAALGPTYTTSTEYQIHGLTGTATMSGKAKRMVILEDVIPQLPANYDTVDGILSATNEYKANKTGSYLVRSSPVPEPSFFILMGLSILALIGARGVCRITKYKEVANT